MSRIRRAVVRLSMAVSLACLAADVLFVHSAALLVAPAAGIASGLAYLASTKDPQ